MIYRIVTEASAAKAINSANNKPAAAEVEPIGFIQAFMLPNVMNYAIAFGFFKLVITFNFIP